MVNGHYPCHRKDKAELTHLFPQANDLVQNETRKSTGSPGAGRGNTDSLLFHQRIVFGQVLPHLDKASAFLENQCFLAVSSCPTIGMYGEHLCLYRNKSRDIAIILHIVQFFLIQITIGSHPLIITKDIVGKPE